MPDLAVLSKGYRRLRDDLRVQGEQISEKRVTRRASLAGIAAPDQVWVTDITYIKTHGD